MDPKPSVMFKSSVELPQILSIVYWILLELKREVKLEWNGKLSSKVGNGHPKMTDQRTYGWVQNPANFNKLKTVVQIFDPKSLHYSELKNDLVPRLIPFEDLKNQLLNKLNKSCTIFSYLELVGSSRNASGRSASTRSEAVADGLIQVSLQPQSHQTKHKEWTDNWTADGYLRWALSLNFVELNRETDECQITEAGLEFSRSTLQPEKDPTLYNALISYPPATRVLRVLYESEGPLSKFAIGDKLGFKGERGFTSYPDEQMNIYLATADASDRSKIKSNVEGTADKYARMISGWLRKIGLVQTHKTVLPIPGETISGFPTYSLTAKGIHEYRRINGSSKNERVIKYLNWEFLAAAGKQPKQQSRNYIRTRRALILRYLQNGNSIERLMSSLADKGFHDSEAVIRNDIVGLNSIGIEIHVGEKSIHLKDRIRGLSIPEITRIPQGKDEVEELKNALMEKTDLPLKYYELVEMAYSGKDSRDFEMLTVDLFEECYGLDTKWLGGSRKPDGIVWHKDDDESLCLIIDTKAYKHGYSKNIQQEDEMVRYVDDVKKKDSEINPVIWWKPLPENLTFQKTYFAWISGSFIGHFEKQLESTARRTETHGCAIPVEELLIGADLSLKGLLTVDQFFSKMASDTVVEFAMPVTQALQESN